jgi:hypothetical protein
MPLLRSRLYARSAAHVSRPQLSHERGGGRRGTFVGFAFRRHQDPSGVREQPDRERYQPPTMAYQVNSILGSIPACPRRLSGATR